MKKRNKLTPGGAKLVARKKACEAQRIAKATQVAAAAKAEGRSVNYRDIEDALTGNSRKPIEINSETKLECRLLCELTPKGRKRLINTAKHLVEAYLVEAGFTPLKNQTGYTLKNATVSNYEELKLVFGPTTQAEKDMHDALDLIGDVMMGRPLVNEINFLAAEGIVGELGAIELHDAAEVVARFHKNYREVGGGKIRNIGLNKPNYDPQAQMEADRHNPEKFRLLKSTSQNRYHVVLFGKLYSFGKKKAASAS